MNSKDFTKKYFLKTLFYAVIAAFGGILFGYHTAAISGSLFFIAKEFNLTIFQQEFLVSLILIGALIGSWLGGTSSDKFGRKNTFFISIIILLISTISFVSFKNLSFIYISRVFVGISIGMISIVTPVYIAEISEPKYRGALVSIYQFDLVLGILLSNIAAYHFSKTGAWPNIFLLGLLPAAIMLLGLFFIPETPSFLASKSKYKKALKILKSIRSKIDESEVLASQKSKEKSKGEWKSLLKKGVKSAFIVGIGLSILRQLSGINIVTYYAPKIFHYAGFNTPTTAMLATTSITCVNLIATMIALWLIDIVGRRPLLFTGLSGMVVSFLGLGSYFLFFPNANGIIAIVCVMLLVSFFAIGLGAITWIINSEIYPMEIRGRAVGISTFINWTCNYIVSISFLSLFHTFGKGYTFGLYGGICLVGLIFVYRKVPETKGKTFLQIQKFWNK